MKLQKLNKVKEEMDEKFQEKWKLFKIQRAIEKKELISLKGQFENLATKRIGSYWSKYNMMQL